MAVTINRQVVVIADGESVSGIVDLKGQNLVGLSMPANFTGTALTFQVFNGGTLYQTMVDGDGNNVSKAIAGNQYMKIHPADFAGIDQMKIVSNASEAEEREIVVHLREID